MIVVYPIVLTEGDNKSQSFSICYCLSKTKCDKYETNYDIFLLPNITQILNAKEYFERTFSLDNICFQFTSLGTNFVMEEVLFVSMLHELYSVLSEF